MLCTGSCIYQARWEGTASALCRSTTIAARGCIYQARWEGTARRCLRAWRVKDGLLHLPSPLGGHCKTAYVDQAGVEICGCIYQARWEGTARVLRDKAGGIGRRSHLPSPPRGRCKAFRQGLCVSRLCHDRGQQPLPIRSSCPCVAPPARSAPLRVLEGSLPATTGPTPVLRTPRARTHSFILTCILTIGKSVLY